MKIQELYEDESWLSKLGKTLWHGFGDDMDTILVPWVDKNLRRHGTQWLYRNVNKELGGHFTKKDLDTAIKLVMSRG